MPIDDTSNVNKSVPVCLLTLHSGETGEFEVVAPEIKDRIELPDDLNNLKATDCHYQMQQEAVDQGASQDNGAALFQGLVGWLYRLKRAVGIFKKKRHVSHTEKVKNVKPRRRGMYVFLYGGRVNVDTFYDYKDKL